MNKFFCDRCDKQIKEMDSYKIWFNKWAPVGSICTNDRALDVCQTCYDLAYHFVFQEDSNA